MLDTQSIYKNQRKQTHNHRLKEVERIFMQISMIVVVMCLSKITNLYRIIRCPSNDLLESGKE